MEIDFDRRICAPVIIFAYKRLLHLKATVESLEKNELCEETEVFIFADAAKDESEKTAVNSVKEYLQQLIVHNKFKQVQIKFADKHMGLADSVIGGVSEIIRKFGRVIVIEDDLYVSTDFLIYMNEALDYYENIDNVWSISGYTFPMKALKKYSHDIYYSYRACSWGWATWLDRWELIDWEVKEYEKFLKDKKWIRNFNRGGGDMSQMLSNQMQGKINSWAIRWCFAQSNLNMYCVHPKISRVLNKGCDGSGTHSSANSNFNTRLVVDYKKCNFEILDIDAKIAREFYLKFTDTFAKKIKRNLRKLIARSR